MSQNDLESPLELSWTFGLNTNFLNSVHFLRCPRGNENAIFYVGSNTGVVYEFGLQQQSLLRGHMNMISCCCVSHDKTIIVTGAQCGPNESAVMIVWNALTKEAVQVIELDDGLSVQTVCVSRDRQHLAALVDTADETSVQTLLIWQLDDASEFELIARSVVSANEEHHFLAFHPRNPMELVSHGKKHVLFWLRSPSALLCREPTKNLINSNPGVGNLTQSAFLIERDSALVSGTTTGDVIIWSYDDELESTASKLNLTNDSMRSPHGAPSLRGNSFTETQQVSTTLDSMMDSGDAAANGHLRRRCRVLFKVLKLCTRGGINCVEVFDEVIALGCQDGAVRFFDLDYRVVGWLDRLNNGQITSMSFPAHVSASLAANMEEFDVPNMVVATNTNTIVYIEGYVEKPVKHVVVETMNTSITCMATHPTEERFAIGTPQGSVQLWNLASKSCEKIWSVMIDRAVCVLKFDPHALYLVVGTENGYIKVFDTKDYSEASFFKSTYGGPIGAVEFDYSGNYFAASQNDRVSLYRFYHRNWDVNRPKEWVLVGHNVAHCRPVSCVHFGLPSGLDPVSLRAFPRLFSVGEDRMLKEYDIQRASLVNGLQILNSQQISTRSIPTNCVLIPGVRVALEDVLKHPTGDELEMSTEPVFDEADGEWKHTEDLLIVFDNHLKGYMFGVNRDPLDQFPRSTSFLSMTESDESEAEHSDLALLRRIVVGPMYGAPVSRSFSVSRFVEPGRRLEPSNVLAFSTFDKMVGLIRTPCEGNPDEVFGICAHPCGISGVCQSHDCEWILTSGDTDRTVNVWRYNLDELESRVRASKETKTKLEMIAPLFEGGMDGKLMEDLTNYFYYVQIRSQGETSTEQRQTSGKITVEEAGDVMRALGYFVSQNDIENLTSEIRYRFEDPNAVEEDLGKFDDVSSRGVDEEKEHVESDANKENENGEEKNEAIQEDPNEESSVKAVKPPPQIDFETFCQLFVNHRSRYPLSLDSIRDAFQVLSGNSESRVVTATEVPPLFGGALMNRSYLFECLQKKGESLSREELLKSLEALTGHTRKNLHKVIPEMIDPQIFVGNILGMSKRRSNRT